MTRKENQRYANIAIIIMLLGVLLILFLVEPVDYGERVVVVRDTATVTITKVDTVYVDRIKEVIVEVSRDPRDGTFCVDAVFDLPYFEYYPELRERLLESYMNTLGSCYD